MEFFDRMLALAEGIEARNVIAQHSHRISNVSTSFRSELADIRKYLAAFHARLHGDLGISTQYGDNSGGLIRFLASIHGRLQDVLQSITHEQQQESTLVGRHRELDSLSWSSLAENITIEHQKLRVLICAFNPYVRGSLIICGSDEKTNSIIQPDFKRWRAGKIEPFIETEIQRCRRNRQQPSSGYDDTFKWARLNNPEYLANISGDSLCDGSSRSLVGFVQCFIRNLQLAKDVNCPPAQRWVYLLICSHYLMSARASQEYRAFEETYHHEHDLRMIGMGLTLQNYVAELELLLFGVLTDLQTEFLNPAQVQERTRNRAVTPQLPPSTSSSGRKESGSAESSRSAVIDDSGVIFRCTLAGEQAGYNLKIRIDHDSRLLLDFNGQHVNDHVDQWPLGLRQFHDVDLRKTSIHPQYRAGVYRCDLYLEARPPVQPRILTAQLTFGDSRDLKQFQRHVTGYKVHIDFKQNIKLRILKKTQFDSRNLNVVTGRLQIWIWKDETDPNVVPGLNASLDRAPTSMSTMSRSSVASTATIRALQHLPGAQVTDVDGGDGVRVRMPIPPLLIMFVESSSKDKDIQSGQILAFKSKSHFFLPSFTPADTFLVDRNAKIDRGKCKCDDRKAKCARCFIVHAARVDLEIGRLKYPTNAKELSWVELTFADDIERETFTEQLKIVRNMHSGGVDIRNRGFTIFHQGRHNTDQFLE
ncbi:hypothetical protein CJF31_00003424 [Rutstroemia sp. NJR-2017a BVV2]|nr:hypothetical protein CJF31_00003424 [Rutstroemia sp. NJR-2017a BVV2]